MVCLRKPIERKLEKSVLKKMNLHSTLESYKVNKNLEGEKIHVNTYNKPYLTILTLLAKGSLCLSNLKFRQTSLT